MDNRFGVGIPMYTPHCRYMSFCDVDEILYAV